MATGGSINAANGLRLSGSDVFSGAGTINARVVADLGSIIDASGGSLTVGDAAAFGIPNDDWGEEVKVVIEPAADTEASDALREDILDFCRDRLAKYKTPRSIDFIAEMPRDPNGKLYKRKLRDPYWEGRDTAI